MPKKKDPKEVAKQIARWRKSGLSDQDIMAQHGEGDLQVGYKWLRDNPGVDPLDSTSSQPRGPRGTGAPSDSLSAVTLL